MKTTKLLWTGLLAGAVAFGAACRTTDTGATNAGITPPPPVSVDPGTGGTGLDNPSDWNTPPAPMPLPDEGTREAEPGVHPGAPPEPGTGGSGLDPEPIDRTDGVGSDRTMDPLNPASPTSPPALDPMVPSHDGRNDVPIR
jgi:hypothetical protein